MTDDRRRHAERVAALLDVWADALRIEPAERHRWQRAAFLHDALKDAPVEVLRVLAPAPWDIDVLRHGPAAAAKALQEGEQDPDVLEAVRYHSVGYAGWGATGQMLYLADYLEPGRDRTTQSNAELRDRVVGDRRGALIDVTRRRLEYQLTRRQRLLPEAVAWWNHLCRAD